MVLSIESFTVDAQYEAWQASRTWETEMADLRKNGPYIWVTWLTKLLVGDNSCEWASWFKAQHSGSSWEKAPSSFDLSSWLIAHTKGINDRRQQWEDEGYTVFTEDQNHFTLKGRVATLSGKPDLIARKGTVGTVIDIKTGKPSPADSIQVMLYMFAVPKALGQYKGVTFDGKIVYNDHEVNIRAPAVDETFVRNVTDLIKRLASDTPARKVPSAIECRFCQITSIDCPERQADDVVEEGQTDVF